MTSMTLVYDVHIQYHHITSLVGRGLEGLDIDYNTSNVDITENHDLGSCYSRLNHLYLYLT